MLEIIGWWEAALAFGVLLLALGEVVGLLAARQASLTKNVSRLVTHGLLAVLSAVYAWVSVWWSGALVRVGDGVVGGPHGVANWGLLLLAGMLGLAFYEMAAHTWAMHLGITRSVGRMITHVAMPTIVALMLMMNLTRWQIYRRGIVEGSVGAPEESGLLQVVAWWELVLVVGVVLLSSRELLGLWAARRAGKTQNTWRLWIYGAIAVLAAIYSWVEISWSRGLDGTGAISVGQHPAMAEWGLVILAALLFLALYAVAALIWARRFGLTDTATHLATHLAIAAFVILIVAINLSRWQMYFGLLEQSYEESIQRTGEPR